MLSTQPSTKRWIGALRHPVFIYGVIAGIVLIGTAVAWLLVANGAPSLEHYAFERNLIAASAMGLVMLVLICRFVTSPARIFLSGVVAWTILAIAYGVMEGRYSGLAIRLTAFHLFMLGALVFGTAAAIAWVAGLVIAARQQHPHPVPATRRRLP